MSEGAELLEGTELLEGAELSADAELSEHTGPLAVGGGWTLLPWDGDPGSDRPSVVETAAGTPIRHRRLPPATGGGWRAGAKVAVGLCGLGAVLGIVVMAAGHRPDDAADHPVAGVRSERPEAIDDQPRLPASADAGPSITAGGAVPAVTVPASSPVSHAGAAVRSAEPPSVSAQPATTPAAAAQSSPPVPGMTVLLPSAQPSSTPLLAPSCRSGHGHGHQTPNCQVG
ncbi:MULTISPECIES: hypothetical protein [unclassified Frankia]|uniref:hypothetical protein n=1 Tax=unclassified Frankia TaxID=2632575 RepID=UPI002AD477BD|nr:MULTISPECIES: hypothetical protein [unclassified Frankia]